MAKVSNMKSYCSIIILNHNGEKELKECLPSLKKQTYKNFEVILVDNASTDNSVNFVKDNFPWVKIVKNSRNLGFCEGNNIGAKHAKGDYLIFLNQDTKVDDHWLEELMSTVTSDAFVGLCGCKILRFDGKTLDSIGAYIDIFGFPQTPESVYRMDNHRQGTTMEVFIPSGPCFIIKRDVWKKIGGFDPLYFCYMENIDLGWRARLAGYKVVTNLRAIVYHKGGTITRKMRHAHKKYLTERNTLRTLLKNYQISTLFQILPIHLTLLLLESITYLFMGNAQTAIACLQAVVWNVKKFKNTWCLHEEIQGYRVISDAIIQNKMIRKSLKVVLGITQLFSGKVLM